MFTIFKFNNRIKISGSLVIQHKRLTFFGLTYLKILKIKTKYISQLLQLSPFNAKIIMTH